MCLFLLITFTIHSQTKEQKRIDSLMTIAASRVNDTGKVMALYQLAIIFRRDNPQKAIGHAEEGLTLARKLKWKKGEADCLKNLGNTYHILSDYPKERECYELSLRIFEDLKDTLGIGKCLNNIGITYYYLSDFTNALEYYQRSLHIMEKFGNKQGIANSLNNIGGIYNFQNDYTKALEYYERTLKIKEEIGDKTGIVICLNNIGNRYKHIADYPKALSYYEKSLKISEEIKDKPCMAASLESIGNMYFLLGDYSKALDYSARSLEQAKKIGMLELQKDVLENLSKAYEKMGQFKKSYQTYKEFIAIKDSIISEDKIRQITQTSMKMQYARKRTNDSLAFEKARLRSELTYLESLHKKNNQRNWLIVTSLAILFFAGALASRLQYTRLAQAKLQKEKDRSENLLINILPAEIAQELKEKGRAEARDFDQVSVLFADIADFTGTTENLTAHELVDEINTCFGAFDYISSNFRVEKIKTIGDSYMAAGGVPLQFSDSVKNTVKAALKMQEFMVLRKKERAMKGLPAFEMRLGIHTGSVVAGIVGVKKFHYDIWGDTVNTASRMESSGVVGKVNISQSTYNCISDDPEFRFEYRGKVVAKNKGCLDMYFVELVNPDVTAQNNELPENG